jgi:DNA-binding IclR family transcriptional regulator
VPLLPSPAVLRACDVLDHLSRHPDESFSVSELARHVEMPRATCHSVLLALAERGWVLRSDTDRRYSIGPGCIAIGDAARNARSVVADIAPVAEKLARTTKSCVAVLMRDRDEVGVAEAFDHGPAFGMRARAGESIPLMPPFGAVFVAWEDEAGVSRWLGRAAVELGTREVRRYRLALAAARRRGYSVTVGTPMSPALTNLLEDLLTGPVPTQRLRQRDQLIRQLARSEYLPADVDAGKPVRMSQMSAPVFDREGRVASALMLLGPDHEISAVEIDALGARLLKAAQAATARLGGRTPQGSEPAALLTNGAGPVRRRARRARTTRS